MAVTEPLWVNIAGRDTTGYTERPGGIATGIFTTRLLPDDQGIGLDRGADAPGALLLVASLMLAVYTIVEAGHYGWGSAHTLGFGALAVEFRIRSFKEVRRLGREDRAAEAAAAKS